MTLLSKTRMLAAAAVLLALSLPAAAQIVPGNSYGGPIERDLVTGYLCTTPACDVLRLPQSDCLCTKENPTEQNLSRLRLRCSMSDRGRWVACPVRPRHGISVD